MAENKRENASVYYLGAGLLFYLIAASVVVFAPWISTSNRAETIKDINGNVIAAPKRVDGEDVGRQIYIRENCYLCHSMVVRGDWVKNEDGEIVRDGRAGDVERYGPISQAGEYAYDIPHLFSTRRIGPDLAREGGKFADAWHVSHFLNPQGVTPGSIMPKYTWLFTNVQYDENGVPTGGDPTVELMDLISYVQWLGTGIGDWRAAAGGGAEGKSPVEIFESASIEQLAQRGEDIYGRVGCVGCHGPEGRGKGAAASTFPEGNRPRNFHIADQFKYGHDPESVTTTIQKGRAPYMPAHPQLKPDEVAALAAFVISLGGQ